MHQISKDKPEVLVIEDDPGHQRLLEIYIKRTGCQCDCVFNGKTGVESEVKSSQDGSSRILTCLPCMIFANRCASLILRLLRSYRFRNFRCSSIFLTTCTSHKKLLILLRSHNYTPNFKQCQDRYSLVFLSVIHPTSLPGITTSHPKTP